MAVTTNRGFRNLKFFKKTGVGADGLPTVGTGIILGKPDDINNKTFALEDTIQETDINADNVTEPERVVTGKSGTVTAYNVTREAYKEIFGFEEDDNGNLVDNPDGARVDGVLFCETEKSDGVRVQHYFYDVTIYAPADSFESFDGTNAREISMDIVIRPVYINGKKRFKASVYSGNTGFVADANPTTIYKPVFTEGV